MKEVIGGRRTAEKLRSAKARIERGWTKRYYATLIDGTGVFPSHPDAASYCAAGAVLAEVYDGAHYDLSSPVVRTFLTAFSRMSGEPLWTDENWPGSVGAWNNMDGRTKDDVVGLFDLAIEIAEGTSS